MSNEIARAVAVQHALLAAGDNDLWQQACTEEQRATEAFLRSRIAEGKAPMAVIFGTAVAVGFLLRAVTAPDRLRPAAKMVSDTVTTACIDGPED